jgi:uncharacterized surface protein with fasciclin (FAS1) repeats
MRRRIIHIFKYFIAALVFAGLFHCGRDKGDEVFYKENELPVTAYLEAHKDSYSTLLEVLSVTGFGPALNAYGHFTFFAPDNEAFSEFIHAYGHTSIADFDVSFLKTLVKYHLISQEIETSYLPNGVLADTTYTGDNLVFAFGEEGLSSIMINGKSMIVERDIQVANGFVNRLDKVLDPVFLSVYDLIETGGDNSIFSQALLETGLSDTLRQIYVPMGEENTVKTRFTVFSEPDAIFHEAGITSFNDLKTRYSDSENLTDPANGLYKFMAYHILTGAYYLNELDSFNYATLAKNKLINVKLTGDILINSHSEQGIPGESASRVIREISNRQARNGVIHSIDKVMEIYDPGAVYFTFDLASYPGLQLGQSYTHEDLEDIKGISAENTGIWYRLSLLDEDSSYLETTTESIGWTVEFTLPPIVPGHYKIKLHWVSDGDRSESVQAFWDGETLGPVFSMRQQKRPPVSPPEWLYDFRVAMDLGTVILDETKGHKIKFFALTEGLGEFDYLSFWPE